MHSKSSEISPFEIWMREQSLSLFFFKIAHEFTQCEDFTLGEESGSTISLYENDNILLFHNYFSIIWKLFYDFIVLL